MDESHKPLMLWYSYLTCLSLVLSAWTNKVIFADSLIIRGFGHPKGLPNTGNFFPLPVFATLVQKPILHISSPVALFHVRLQQSCYPNHTDGMFSRKMFPAFFTHSRLFIRLIQKLTNPCKIMNLCNILLFCYIASH